MKARLVRRILTRMALVGLFLASGNIVLAPHESNVAGHVVPTSALVSSPFECGGKPHFHGPGFGFTGSNSTECGFGVGVPIAHGGSGGSSGAPSGEGGAGSTSGTDQAGRTSNPQGSSPGDRSEVPGDALDKILEGFIGIGGGEEVQFVDEGEYRIPIGTSRPGYEVIGPLARPGPSSGPTGGADGSPPPGQAPTGAPATGGPAVSQPGPEELEGQALIDHLVEAGKKMDPAERQQWIDNYGKSPYARSEFREAARILGGGGAGR